MTCQRSSPSAARRAVGGLTTALCSCSVRAGHRTAPQALDPLNASSYSDHVDYDSNLPRAGGRHVARTIQTQIWQAFATSGTRLRVEPD